MLDVLVVLCDKSRREISVMEGGLQVVCSARGQQSVRQRSAY
jgi:hypothetical protein